MREVFKILNKATAVLTESVDTGTQAVYVTIDRQEYNDLLKALTEAKKLVLQDRVL